MALAILNGFFETHKDVENIHFQYVSLSGVLASHCVPKWRCLNIAYANASLKVSTLTLVGLCSWRSLPSRSISGYDSLCPDWSSIRYLGSEEASVMCSVSEEESHLREAEYFLKCPRHTLQRTLTFGMTLGLSFLVGFEIEFYLVDSTTVKHPADYQVPFGYKSFQKHALALLGRPGECIRLCVRRLQGASIQVEGFHACGGPSQFEIATSPCSPLEAADKLVQSLEIIRRCAIECDFRAIFLPKPFEGVETSGLHMHLSIHHADADVSNIEPSRGDSFMAGVLARLPGLAALGMPFEPSYRRITDVAAGRWVAWGIENRDVPVRAVSKTRWEFRAIDATSNIYLVAAGYLAAGCLGVQQEAVPVIKNSTEILSAVDPAILRDRGICTEMPPSFRLALDALGDPKWSLGLPDILGEEMFRSFIDVKRGEQLSLAKMDEPEKKFLFFNLF